MANKPHVSVYAVRPARRVASSPSCWRTTVASLSQWAST